MAIRARQAPHQRARGGGWGNRRHLDLVSGTTASTSWYLHNEIREKLLSFLQELDDGAYLPRRRHALLPGEQGQAT